MANDQLEFFATCPQGVFVLPLGGRLPAGV